MMRGHLVTIDRPPAGAAARFCECAPRITGPPGDGDGSCLRCGLYPEPRQWGEIVIGTAAEEIRFGAFVTLSLGGAVRERPR